MNGNDKQELNGCIVDVKRLCQSGHLRQIGVICFGGGLNHRHAIAEERVKGHVVSVKDGHALIYACV